MSDMYYRDREIKLILSDRIKYNKVLYSNVEIHIGDKNHPIIEAETLQEAIKQFDKWCINHHIGSEVK